MSLMSRIATGASTLAAAVTLVAAPARAQSMAASDLRVTLNTGLAEHVWLAAAATIARWAMPASSGDFPLVSAVRQDAAQAPNSGSARMTGRRPFGRLTCIRKRSRPLVR